MIYRHVEASLDVALVPRLVCNNREQNIESDILFVSISNVIRYGLLHFFTEFLSKYRILSKKNNDNEKSFKEMYFYLET